jgi:predicted TIM-barrel fold metal-dependent hydrolase
MKIYRRFKGVALMRADASARALRDLAERGIVGLRFNLSSFGMRELTELGADRLLAQARELVTAMPYLRRAGLRIMIDHCGRPDPAHGIDQPGFAALLELGRSGRHVVKLSGPFRSSHDGYPYRDIDPYVAACLDVFTPERCV